MRFLDLKANPDLAIPRPPAGEPVEVVRHIVQKVIDEADRALFELTEQFDKVKLDSLRVPQAEIDAAFEAAPPELVGALEEAAGRIRTFAGHQAIKPWEAEIGGGMMGETVHPVARAGCYVPGGRGSYPSSVLMTAIPAAVAGVPEIALCVPPGPDGTIPQATLAAAKVAGVTELYRVGGAQAIAALAYGTESIPKVEVIVGPGNIYVALAKQQVAGLVGIDSIAGPSEIAVVTDGNSDPRVIAFDLVAQAEHGPDGTFALVTWNEKTLVDVALELTLIESEIDAPEGLKAALERGCVGVAVADLDQAADVINQFAPEHLELLFEGAENEYHRFRYAGAVFVGPWSPVPLGDYVAGSNHVLPTGGGARWASGLRTSHFQRTSAVIRHTKDSLAAAAKYVEAMAEAEGLLNHGRAVAARFAEPVPLQAVEWNDERSRPATGA
ncbi:MAG TPA: histidinol dehydrogenase [Actinomycetota bacterium]|nr:histidinol dehydrogenase [Actinomycetota bacterium]